MRLFTKLLTNFSFLTILICSNAYATDHYFDNGSPDNTLPCTIGDPCDNFAGTTLDNANALACGDTVNLKRGEIWEGSEAPVIIYSGTTSCAGNPIIVQAYGTGADPILAGGPIVSAGWTNLTGNIWYLSGQTQQLIQSVTQNDNKGLYRWMGNNNNLPAGTFCRSASATAGSACNIALSSGTFLFVNLHDGADPSTSSVRVPSYAHTADANGSRGLLSAGTRAGKNTYGHYVRFRDIDVINSNGVGFSASGTNVWDADLEIMGAGKDGWLAYSDLITSLENSDSYRSYGTTVSYSALNQQGSGSGQGWTTYASLGWWVLANAEYNCMAGFDWLNFGPSTAVTESGCLWCYATDNGLSQTNPSYDSNYYGDGGSKLFLYGVRSHRSGVGTGNAGNARTGISFGSEHPSTDPATNFYLINSWVDQGFWKGAGVENTTSATANITGLHIAYSTIISYRSGGQSFTLNFNDTDTTIADGMELKNNIFYPENGASIANMGSGTLDFLDSDGNQFYRQGGTEVTFNVNSSNRTLAQWQSDSGEDSNSGFGDPLFVDDNESGGFDVTLGDGSPAIDQGVVGAYTVPTWLPQTIKDYLGTAGVRGSTRASGVEDNYDTAPDAGYHKSYGELTSTNLEPASLLEGTVGTMSVTFTIPELMGYFPYNGKIKFTLPTGFTADSGGSTAFTSSDITGTFSDCSVSGQDVTCTRVGDGNSEFPGNYTGNLTFISNPANSGTSASYKIYILKSDDSIITQDLDVPGDTITETGVSPHLSCSGKALSITGKFTIF